MGTAQESGKCLWSGLLLCDGLLCYTRSRNEVSFVIPEDAGLWADLLQYFHDDPCGGQLGVYCMVGALSKRYWWKRLHADVKQCCK